MTSLLLTVTQLCAVPASAPPTRQCNIEDAVGLAAVIGVLPAGPSWNSVGELVGPASSSRPASVTPSTSATVKSGVAVVGDQRRQAEPEHDQYPASVTWRLLSRW